jgi:hypothetical protein
MEPNTNPETGIRYGIISANSLKPDVVEDIRQNGRDVRWEEASAELWAEVKAVCKDKLFDTHSDGVADFAVDRMGEAWIYDDEPVHEFELDGVKGRTAWLGGALHVYVFESPHTGEFDLGSPCVPNACILESPNKSGFTGYDVPAEWRYNDGETP